MKRTPSRRRSPERQIQAAIMKFLRLALPRDAWVGAIPGGDGRATRAPGYVAGTPDVLIVYRGRAHFIEVKSAKGKLSIEQTIQGNAVRMAGAQWGVARSIVDAEWLCRIWRIPLRASAAPAREAA